MYFVANTERQLRLLKDEENTLLFQAELLREIGRFDESISVLYKIPKYVDRETVERIYLIMNNALAIDNPVFVCD